jgi:signal transduction histidine kinase
MINFKKLAQDCFYNKESKVYHIKNIEHEHRYSSDEHKVNDSFEPLFKLNRIMSSRKNYYLRKSKNLWDNIVFAEEKSKRVNITDSGEDLTTSTTKREYVYEMTQRDIVFNGLNCRLLIVRDILELSNVEYARSLEKITEVMIASTSHDMRTPLNTIINMIKLIQGRIRNEPQVNKWLKIASNSTNLLLYLVNDTLDYF